MTAPVNGMKHMRHAATFILLVCGIGIHAQSISLPGTVVIQNSEYETGHRIYVSDASVRAPFAKAVSSDKQGQFALDFAGVQSGTPVRLNVSKPGMEVVNSTETEQVILGRVPQMQVVMADADKLAAAQVKYYNIATESITKSYERRMSALRAENTAVEKRLAALNAETGQKLATLEEAIDLLTSQRNDGLQHAQELAQQFAEVNLDDASALYRHAYEAFQRGQLDSVLLILSEEKLHEEYDKLNDQKARAQDVVKKSNEGIRQLFDSYDLKFSVLETSVKYKEARVVMEEMKAILAAHPEIFPPEVRVMTLKNSGGMYWETGEYDLALKEDTAAWDLAARDLPPDHYLLSEIQFELSSGLVYTGRVDEGIEALRRSIAISEVALGVDNDDLARNYNSLGVALQENQDHRAGLEQFRHALRIGERDTVKHAVELGVIHLDMGAALLELGEPTQALEETRKGLAINLRVLSPDHPDLAASYRQLSTMLAAQGQLQAAEEAAEQCLAIDLRSLGPDHPQLAIVYNQLGTLMVSHNDHRAALDYFKKGLALSRKFLKKADLTAVMLCTNTGYAYAHLGQPDSALMYMREGLTAEEKSPIKDAYLVTNLVQMADVFQTMGRLDSTRFYYQRSLDMALDVLGSDHPTTADCYLYMARLEREAGNFVVAMKDYQKCMGIRRALFGEDSPKVIELFQDLSIAYNYADRPDSAIAYASKYLALKRELNRSDSIGLANQRCVLAWALAKQGALDSALALARQQLDIYHRSFPGEYSAAGTAYTVIGWILEKKGDMTSSLHAFRTGLEENRRQLGPGHWKIARSQYYIGRVLYEQGAQAEALSELDSSFAVKPTRDAAWFRYRIASDQHDGAHAVDRLAEFMRIPEWMFGKLPVDREEQKNVLREQATKLHRKDLLEEFDLN